jgi:hypothetical protein
MLKLKQLDDITYYKAGEFNSTDINVKLYSFDIIQEIDTDDLPPIIRAEEEALQKFLRSDIK